MPNGSLCVYLHEGQVETPPVEPAKGLPPTDPPTATATETAKGECSICLSPWTNPVATQCGHIFCAGCAPNQGELCHTCRVPVIAPPIKLYSI